MLSLFLSVGTFVVALVARQNVHIVCTELVNDLTTDMKIKICVCLVPGRLISDGTPPLINDDQQKSVVEYQHACSLTLSTKLNFLVLPPSRLRVSFFFVSCIHKPL